MPEPPSPARPLLRPPLALVPLFLSLAASSASAQEVTWTTDPPEPEAQPEAASPRPPRGPPATDFRYELMVGGGPGAPGAPSFLFGGGVALGVVRKVRVEANLLVGGSISEDVPADAWPEVYGTTYLSGSARSASVALELSGSWRAGRFELWAGGGVHFTAAVVEAEYDMNVCHGDLSILPPFCNGTVTVERETDGFTGSFVVAPAVGVGARLPIVDRLLVGLDVRYLVGGSSRVGELDVDRRVGGLSASLGLVWRVGPAGPVRPRPGR